MNHIHRLVFNPSTNTWVAVAENARGRGKGSPRKLVAAALSLAVGLAQAAPLGGTVASGAGSISQAGSATTILQTTPSLTLNWKSFNIGAAESVKFVQPSSTSVAVNRIHDTQGSQLLGRLSANGQVYLINPNGILFGKDAQVNVAGLHASTQTLNNTGTGSATSYGPGSIVNHGTLTALNGGFVTLQADTVTNTGLISAQTVGTQTGRIVLLGNMKTGTVNVGGTLDASAPHGGNGGFIETSAAYIKFTPNLSVTTLSALGQGGRWLIDPLDFTIAASGGDLSGGVLGSLLKGGNITIQAITSSTAVAGALVGATSSTTGGNINVEDLVSWSSNKLTLKADNNIYINARMAGSGTASLALEYGQGSTKPTTTHVNAGNYYVKARVDLPAGLNFSTRLGSDGDAKIYTVVTSLGAAADAAIKPAVTTLQGIAHVDNLGGNYVLGGNIDASSTSTSAWLNTTAGFKPIGNTAARFRGVFDGLGHTITGLYINLPAIADVGLFGFAYGNTVIQNVGLLGGSVVGGAGTGALVGNNDLGVIRNSYSTGRVTGGAGAAVGGLIGHNFGGNISDNYTTGEVFAPGAAYVGGLVGVNTTGNISRSYASGNVSGAAGTGGLVGTLTTGNVTDSHASGTVIGAAGTGGLVGTISTGTVFNSYATGTVTGAAGSGGLVGTSTGTITQSYAAGNVVGADGVGGLVGTTTGLVSVSYARGYVDAASNGGGLIGTSTAPVINTFATGNVTAKFDHAGGLIGATTGDVSNSYASGNVSGPPANSGGLIGTNSTTSHLSNNVWNTGSGFALAIGGTTADGPGSTSLSLTAMEVASNFTGSSTSSFAVGTPAGWDFNNIWTISQGGKPVLKGLTAPTAAPTAAPPTSPTSTPTVALPTSPTSTPTAALPTSPTSTPTAALPTSPISYPTVAPPTSPISNPTVAPPTSPISNPTVAPNSSPVAAPTASPTLAPTALPRATPTAVPTVAPTGSPIAAPTAAPTAVLPKTPVDTADAQLPADATHQPLCRAAGSTANGAQLLKFFTKANSSLPSTGNCNVEITLNTNPK